MDIWVPQVETDRGNKYILMINYNSCVFNVQAYAMKNHEAETVADILASNWKCKFGEPEQL